MMFSNCLGKIRHKSPGLPTRSRRNRIIVLTASAHKMYSIYIFTCENQARCKRGNNQWRRSRCSEPRESARSSICRIFPNRPNMRAREAYDRISSGDALEIVSTRRPGHLFAEFRACYGSAFYWWPLENRPGVWRVMVAKPAPEPATTVAGVMGADPHRPHDLWRDFVRGVEICRIDDLSCCFGEFALGLHRHIAIEEAMLFPLLEAQTEMKFGGPTSAMRREHRRIEAMLDRLNRLGATRQCAAIPQGFDDEPDEPSALLANHDSKEEAILHPFIDRIFDPVERRELLSAVQEFEI